MDGDYLAVTQNLGGGCGHFLQGLNGLFGLALLIYTKHGVNNNNRKNDDNIGKALALHHCKHTADGGCRQQDDYHGVSQLLKKTLEQGLSRRGSQLVFAVCLKSGLCFL